jgi:hypothetical protein
MLLRIIIAAGLFVAASQFLPILCEPGGAAVLALGTISVLAAILTLLASTIGGSSGIDGSEALLVFSLSMVAVFEFSLVRIGSKNKSPQ